GCPAPPGRGLLVSPTRLTATAAPGSVQTFSVSVTNAGAGARTVRPAVLGLESMAASEDAGDLALSPATAPTFVDGGGTTSAYQLHPFSVPAGAQRLDGDLTWGAANQRNARVRETLFDPAGRLAAYSLPQGPGGFGRPVCGPQALAFEFDGPAGRPSLALALRLRAPGYNLTGILIDPGGEPVNEQSTGRATATGTAFADALELLVRTPRAGRWT